MSHAGVESRPGSGGSSLLPKVRRLGSTAIIGLELDGPIDGPSMNCFDPPGAALTLERLSTATRNIARAENRLELIWRLFQLFMGRAFADTRPFGALEENALKQQSLRYAQRLNLSI